MLGRYQTHPSIALITVVRRLLVWLRTCRRRCWSRPWRRLWRQALAIPNEYYRAQALSALASHLPEPLLRQALAIPDEHHRANALSALAPRLPAPLLPQALDAALAIHDDDDRAQALEQCPTELNR
jgi:hypothetical protein